MNLTETTDMARLKLQFESNSDFKMERKQLLGQEVVFCYFRPFVDLAHTNQLLSWMESSPISDWLQQISLLNGQLNTTYDMQMSSLMEGYLVVYLLDNPIRNFVIKPVPSTIKRTINIPQNENVIESSFGAFNEDLDTNMALIRGELRSPTLTMNTMMMGTKQPKRTTLAYLSDSVNHRLLSSLMKKLEANKTKEFSHLQEIIKVLGEGNFRLISPCLTSERPAEAADHLKNGRGWTPNTSIVYLWEAFRGVYSYTEDFALPIIKPGERTMFKLDGSAIMCRGVMVGTISSDDTLIYNVMKGDYQGANVEVMEHASVLLIDVDFKHRHHWDGDTPQVETDMKVIGMLLETKGNPNKEQIKEEIKNLLSKRATAMIAKLQENQSDLFGYGQYFRNDLSHAQLKEWRKNWYPRLKVTLNVKVNLRNSGNLKFNTIDS